MNEEQLRRLGDPWRALFVDTLGLESLAIYLTKRKDLAYSAPDTARAMCYGGIGIADWRSQNAGGELSFEDLLMSNAEPSPKLHMRAIREKGKAPGAEKFPYATGLQAASASFAALGTPVVIDCRLLFDAPQFYGGSGGIASANDLRMVRFTRGYKSIWPDGEFSGTDDVTMDARLPMFPASRYGMHLSSHDAFFLSAHRGRHIPIQVFAALVQVKPSMILRPYHLAVWAP
jgi:hypothetical protein